MLFLLCLWGRQLLTPLRAALLLFFMSSCLLCSSALRLGFILSLLLPFLGQLFHLQPGLFPFSLRYRLVRPSYQVRSGALIYRPTVEDCCDHVVCGQVWKDIPLLFRILLCMHEDMVEVQLELHILCQLIKTIDDNHGLWLMAMWIFISIKIQKTLLSLTLWGSFIAQTEANFAASGRSCATRGN